MKRKILLNLIMGLSAMVAYSQTDSVKVEYSQEKITKQSKMDEAICDILTRREKREKDLWKLNLAGTFLGGFDVSYERRVAAKWSCNIQSITNFSSAIYGGVIKEYFQILDNRDGAFGFSQYLNFQLRYYYNFNQRARLGRKCGFSGNYFALALNNQYLFRRFELSHAYVSNGVLIQPPRAYEDIVRNSFNLMYGLQRKIGRIFYVDASIGLGWSIDHLSGTRGANWIVLDFFVLRSKLGIGIAF